MRRLVATAADNLEPGVGLADVDVVTGDDEPPPGPARLTSTDPEPLPIQRRHWRGACAAWTLDLTDLPKERKNDEPADHHRRRPRAQARHRALWALGNYPAVAAEIIPSLGPVLVAEALPFGDAEFDVVMSCVGVMFAPHHDASAAERRRLVVDHFATPEQFRDYFKANYGPTIATYRGIADQPDRVAALDDSLVELAARNATGHGSLAMDWEYLLLTARRR